MSRGEAQRPELRPEEYRGLAELLRQWTGIRLQSGQVLMVGRLGPRMRALGLARYADYLRLLESQGSGSPEAERFVNAMTTNKTSFFREAHHFEYLRDQVFAQARARAGRGEPRRVRLFSAACSLGAEPYSMAVLAAQHLPVSEGWDVRILATDLDTKVLDHARRALYEVEEIESVPRELRRWFVREGGRMRVAPEAAGRVTFAQANLVANPFPVRGEFDAIFCRNVMIYFEKETQDRLVRELLRLLRPDGILAVGHSESFALPEIERERVVGVYRLRPGMAPRHEPRAQAAAAKPKPRERPKPRTPPAERRIVLGQWFASDKPHIVSTLLGSCVAACIFDLDRGVGGMNHFMLPSVGAAQEDSARFGVHGMEVLINALMRLGADRRRLKAKAFGAGAVNRALSSDVARKNEAFIRDFLAREGIELVGARLGGTSAREVRMRTDTGEAWVREVKGGQHTESLHKQELAAHRAPVEKPADKPFDPDDVLF